MQNKSKKIWKSVETRSCDLETRRTEERKRTMSRVQEETDKKIWKFADMSI